MMHTLSYKIRPKQVSLLLNQITHFVSQISLFIMIPMSQLFTEIFWKSMLISLGFGLLVALLVQQYFKPKVNRLTLKIDNNYITTTSDFLNKSPHSKPIHVQDIDKVEYVENLVADIFGRLLTKSAPDLKDFKRCLIIYSSQTDKFGTFNKQRYIIAESTWQIDDFNELIAFFTQLGYPPQPTSSQNYIQ